MEIFRKASYNSCNIQNSGQACCSDTGTHDIGVQVSAVLEEQRRSGAAEGTVGAGFIPLLFRTVDSQQRPAQLPSVLS